MMTSERRDGCQNILGFLHKSTQLKTTCGPGAGHTNLDICIQVHILSRVWQIQKYVVNRIFLNINNLIKHFNTKPLFC